MSSIEWTLLGSTLLSVFALSVMFGMAIGHMLWGY